MGVTLERGLGSEAAQLLTPVLRSGALSPDDDMSVRVALTKAWLLQHDLTGAANVLDRTPGSIRDAVARRARTQACEQPTRHLAATLH